MTSRFRYFYAGAMYDGVNFFCGSFSSESPVTLREAMAIIAKSKGMKEGEFILTALNTLPMPAEA
jgi:hypothetical protein